MDETGKIFNKREYDNNYKKDNLFQLRVWLPKDSKELLKRLSEEKGESITKLVIDAIEKTYNITLK